MTGLMPGLTVQPDRAPISPRPALQYNADVSCSPSHFSEADVVADGVLRRRLVNCLLTVVAGWLLSFALGGVGLDSVAAWISLLLASGVTGGAAGFVTWALLVGDQRVWAHACRRARMAARDS